MKYSIWCFLFGHRWYTRNTLYKPEEDDYYIVSSASNWCYKCGLSKEEVGIKKEGV